MVINHLPKSGSHWNCGSGGITFLVVQEQYSTFSPKSAITVYH